MSIQPPSDIILDVVKAADPQRAQAMAGRLRQVSDATAAGATGFGETLAGESIATSAAAAMGAGGDAFSPLGMSSVRTLSNATALASDDKAGASPAYRRFEAMVLSGFVDSLLPKASSTLFGAGTAGQVWRSMLAERIADEVSKSGGIGLAQRLAAVRGAQGAS